MAYHDHMQAEIDTALLYRSKFALAHLSQQRIEAIVGLSGGQARLPSASTIMLHRASLNGLRIPDKVSAGGGCRLYQCLDGWVSLNLSRADDITLIPALMNEYEVRDIAKAMSNMAAGPLVERGRTLGLAIAAVDENPASPPFQNTVTGLPRAPVPKARDLRVLDLAALWAGPLASNLLLQAGCSVMRIESSGRPDPLRNTDPAHFALLNDGKRLLNLDLRTLEGRDRLLAEICGSDIVIEAARPRALYQLGIDPDALVHQQPGLTWITITGHGTAGESANWVGFGDDCGVCGGLSREYFMATGRHGFVGDAIADPVAGIAAAECALKMALSGLGGRCILSMSALVAEAIAAEKQYDPLIWTKNLQYWAQNVGQPIAMLYTESEHLAAC